MSTGFTQNVGSIAAAQLPNTTQQVAPRDNPNLGADNPNIARAAAQIPEKTATNKVEDRERSIRRPKHVDGSFASDRTEETKPKESLAQQPKHRGKVNVVA
jgi:hypothetical protein